MFDDHAVECHGRSKATGWDGNGLEKEMLGRAKEGCEEEGIEGIGPTDLGLDFNGVQELVLGLGELFVIFVFFHGGQDCST